MKAPVIQSPALHNRRKGHQVNGTFKHTDRGTRRPCFGKEAIASVASVGVLLVWRSVCCAFRALAHISVFVLPKEKSRSGFHRLGYLLLFYEVVYNLPVNASFL